MSSSNQSGPDAHPTANGRFEPAPESWTEYLEGHRDRLLRELFDFLSIPSVSALPRHAADMARAAEWLAHRARAAGFTHAYVDATGGHPLVRANWLGAPGAPTILLYGHYDVQPAEPFERWTSPPFEPVVRDGALFARGASDDKGQVFLHLAVVEALLRRHGTLPVNLKLLVEGEEEISSPYLTAYLSAHAPALAADVAVISDTALLAPGVPTICTSLRGICAAELTVRTAATDLHSGQYGGAVPNALHVLAELLAGLHDAYGRVAVPGFYAAVRPVSAAVDLDAEELRRRIGARMLWGETGQTLSGRLWHRPTLEVNGAWGGFIGEGAKTVIPCEAYAKLTARLVPDQDPEAILALIAQHLQDRCPPTAELIFHAQGGGRPAAVDRDHPAVQAAARALEGVFGRQVALIGEGGSIPVVQTLAETLGLETVLLGFGLPGDNCHAPDEHLSLQSFELGFRSLCALWPELARALPPSRARIQLS